MAHSGSNIALRVVILEHDLHAGGDDGEPDTSADSDAESEPTMAD